MKRPFTALLALACALACALPAAAMTYVDPAKWVATNNQDAVGVVVGGANYCVQNGGKAYSLTAPAADTVRFELHPGDKWSGDGAAAKERTEICGSATFAPGTAIHVAYGFTLEPGATNHADWTVIGQFHQTAADGWSPPFEIDLVGERLAILVNYKTASGAQAWKTLWTDPAPIVRGRESILQVDATFDATKGALKVARDGVVLVNYAGPMGWANMGTVYWKEGIYRSASDTTIAADYRGLSVTTGAVVVPLPPTTPAVDVAALQAQVASLTAQAAAQAAAIAQLQAKVAAGLAAANSAVAALR